MNVWLKKNKWWVIIGGTFLIFTLVNDSFSSPAANIESVPTSNLQQNVQVQPPPVYVSPTPQPATNNLSNDNYYKNIDGNTVHSPAYSNDGSVPIGASARCRDGTYSFSQNRRGTCSHHGGVSTWLR